MSAIVLCGTLAVFAAGTLDVGMFRFPKASSRVLMLDRVIEEQHRNNRREDTVMRMIRTRRLVRQTAKSSIAD